MKKEIWKSVPNWPVYEVSNYGRVYSHITNRIKSVDENTAGYYRITFYRNKKQKRYFIHRLVAMLFVKGYFDGYVVNHIDGNKHNNFAGNLEWVSQSENAKQCFALGLHNREKKNVRVKVLEIDTMDVLEFPTVVACANYYGIDEKRIHYRMSNYKGYIPEINSYVGRMSND